jgi:hypothetical protein
MANAINAGRNLIERGRAAADREEQHSRALPFFLTALAGLIGGYLIGRRTPERVPTASTNGAPPPEAEPSMEVATAVELSRPQPAGLDEIVPPVGAKS